jgi:hypothetical protein
MLAEGWHRDPFAIHDDRWICDGQPTSLVRDHGAQSCDEPPPGEPPGPLVPSDPASLGEFPAPQSWRYWTVLPPCLLALVVSVLVIIDGAAFMAMNGFDFAEPGTGWLQADIAGQVVAGLAAMALLGAAGYQPRRRRAIALAAWIIAPTETGWSILSLSLSGLAR